MRDWLAILGRGSILALGLIVAAAVLAVNLTIAAIGISTVPDDAPGAWAGIIRLLIVIASWPWWAYGSVLVICTFAYLIQIMKMLQLIKASRAMPDQIERLREAIDLLTQQVQYRSDEAERLSKIHNDRRTENFIFIEETRRISDLSDDLLRDIKAEDFEPRKVGFDFDWPAWHEVADALVRRMKEIEPSLTCHLYPNWGKALLSGPSFFFDDGDRHKIGEENIEKYIDFTRKTYRYRTVKSLFDTRRQGAFKL